MSDITGIEDLIILLVASLVPALAWLAWVRQGERYSTEGWGPLLSSFAYGALFATFVAGIFELIIVGVGTAVSQKYPGPETLFLNGNSSLGAFFLVLIIAPFVEEAFKAAGVVRSAAGFRLVADGPVVGAAVGLGFGFFETFLYGLGAFFAGGLLAGILLIVLRSVSSVLLHGSTTSLFGYGYAQERVGGKKGLTGAYYLLAVTMHAGFNALASLGAILAILGYGTTYVNDATIVSLFLVIAYAFAAIAHVRTVIARSDFPGAEGGHPRFRPPPVKTRAKITPAVAPQPVTRRR
jgi:RsiW-degrading membrane proteinase PrsW (M82 family)